MSTTQLGPRPSSPALISFDARCFVEDGVSVEWIVGGNKAPHYPAKFASEAAALAFAARTGRQRFLRRAESPRLVRVSWQ